MQRTHPLHPPLPPRSAAARRGRREGIALVMALAAIVVIGALVAGGFYASTQEFRAGRNAVYEPRAMAVAEYGLGLSVEQLRKQPVALANDGDTATSANMPTRTYVAFDRKDTATIRFTRLTRSTYWLESRGVAGGASEMRTARRTGLLLRHVVPQINFLAALTTNGPTQIGGSSQITGNDTDPKNWSCPPGAPAKPGIVTNDLSNIKTSGNKVSVTGADPPVQANPAAGDTSTYFKFGEADWASMALLANIRLPVGWGGAPSPLPMPALATSVCEVNDPNRLNWGEPWVPTPPTPLHPCATYFPIIYAEGDLHINGGRGQGILLVNGDLEVQGQFQFYGPVIVRGRLKTTGTGGHFNGGVMAANVELDQNVVLGDAVISYSSCAINKAINNAATQYPIRGRGWATLF